MPEAPALQFVDRAVHQPAPVPPSVRRGVHVDRPDLAGSRGVTVQVLGRRAGYEPDHAGVVVGDQQRVAGP